MTNPMPWKQYLVLVACAASACVMAASDLEDGGVVVVSEPLQPAVPYTKINSNDGAPLCDIVNSQCTSVSSTSSQGLYRCIRSLAQTRHPGSGSNAWGCAASSTQGDCQDHTRPGRLQIKNCSGSTPRICQFGSAAADGSAFAQEGIVKVPVNVQTCAWEFSDGGIGESNLAGHVFFYAAP